MDPKYIAPSRKEGDGQGKNSSRFKLANFSLLNSIQTHHLIVSTKILIIETKLAKNFSKLKIRIELPGIRK